MNRTTQQDVSTDGTVQRRPRYASTRAAATRLAREIVRDELAGTAYRNAG